MLKPMLAALLLVAAPAAFAQQALATAQAVAGAFTLDPLPYATDALAPVMPILRPPSSNTQGAKPGR